MSKSFLRHTREQAPKALDVVRRHNLAGILGKALRLGLRVGVVTRALTGAPCRVVTGNLGKAVTGNLHIAPKGVASRAMCSTTISPKGPIAFRATAMGPTATSTTRLIPTSGPIPTPRASKSQTVPMEVSMEVMELFGLAIAVSMEVLMEVAMQVTMEVMELSGPAIAVSVGATTGASSKSKTVLMEVLMEVSMEAAMEVSMEVMELSGLAIAVSMEVAMEVAMEVLQLSENNWVRLRSTGAMGETVHMEVVGLSRFGVRKDPDAPRE